MTCCARLTMHGNLIIQLPCLNGLLCFSFYMYNVQNHYIHTIYYCSHAFSLMLFTWYVTYTIILSAVGQSQ